jgi:hypothetical protein
MQMSQDGRKISRQAPQIAGAKYGAAAGRATAPPLDVVIGLDYGTRFTKVAIGIGRDRRVWADETGKGLIPSVVYVTGDTTVVTYPHKAPPNSVKIEYLKMLLAGDVDDVFRSASSQAFGRSIKDNAKPLAAAFLSNLIRTVRTSIIRQRPDLAERPLSWFLNMGVPVQHCDSNAEAFREVAAVALHWSQGPEQRMNIDQLRSAYERAACSLDLDSSPASVVPELTAALHEFVRDPNRADDLYGFFDIGGGTIDGAIFRINRSGIGMPLRIHAARVICAGSMAICRTMLAELFSRLPHYLEGPLLGGDNAPKIMIPLSEPLTFRNKKSAEEEIQDLVGTVIVRTKRQLYGEMFSPRVDATAQDTRPLRAFLAGGGASSGWYKSTIEDTYHKRQLHKWGLTGLGAEIVSKPMNYSGNDFPRFVIALGLADANAALADAQLPSKMRDAEALPIRPMPTSITKDLV